MKKLILAIVAFATLTPNANAQVFEEGNISIDAYYGFPNLYTAVFKAAYVNSGSSENIVIGGIGPVGVRAEYLLTDKVGLGIDVGLNNTILTFSETGSYYNNTTGNYETRTYDYEFKTQKLGVMVTFNYHFIESDKVDFYGMLGVGYGKRSFTFTSTDPNYTPESLSGIPVASRIGIGLRYFFTENLGANIGAGFGQGGLLNAGLSLKF